MKIHIVQKGDTLWDIAQKYEVDFEQLKSLNVQISSPDMIMPGMKINIPTEQKQVTHQDSKKQDLKQKSTDKKNKHEHKSFEHSLKPHALPTLEDDNAKKPLAEKGTYLSSSEKVLEQTKPSIKQAKKVDEKYTEKLPSIQHSPQYSPPFVQQPIQQPLLYHMPPPPMPCCQQLPYYYWPMQQMPQYAHGNANPFHHPHTHQQHYYGQNMGQPKR